MIFVLSAQADIAVAGTYSRPSEPHCDSCRGRCFKVPTLSLLLVCAPDGASSNSSHWCCSCRLLLNCSTLLDDSTAAPSLQPAARTATSSPSQVLLIPSSNGATPAPSLRTPSQQIPQTPGPLERDFPMHCTAKPCSPDRRCDTSNGQCVCKPGWYACCHLCCCFARKKYTEGSWRRQRVWQVWLGLLAVLAAEQRWPYKHFRTWNGGMRHRRKPRAGSAECFVSAG